MSRQGAVDVARSQSDTRTGPGMIPEPGKLCLVLVARTFRSVRLELPPRTDRNARATKSTKSDTRTGFAYQAPAFPGRPSLRKKWNKSSPV